MTPEASPNALIDRLFALGGGRDVPRMLGNFRLVADADSAFAVFRHPDVFVKDYGALDFLGQSRVHADGAEWRARRSLTQDGFNAAAMDRERIAAVFDEAVARIAGETDSDGIDPEALGQNLTHTTIRLLLIALDAEHDPTALAAMHVTLRGLTHALQTASLTQQHGVDMPKLLGEITALRARFQRHADAEPVFGRLLDRMVNRYAGNAAAFQPIDEFVTSLIAGAETSSVVLGWAMLMLGTFPALQEALRTAAAANANANDDIERFLNETMRLLPPVPLVTRKLAERFSSEAFTAEAGDIVLVSVIGIHLDPAQWRSPRLFIPARPKYADKAALKHAFVPFLHGPRSCGGMALARIELIEGMRALLKHFRFRRTDVPLSFNYALAMAPVLKDRLIVERIA